MFVFCNPCARAELHQQKRVRKLCSAILSITKMYDSKDRTATLTLQIEFQIYPQYPPFGRHLGMLKNIEKCYFAMFLFLEAHDILPRRILGIIILDIISILSVVVQAMITS